MNTQPNALQYESKPPQPRYPALLRSAILLKVCAWGMLVGAFILPTAIFINDRGDSAIGLSIGVAVVMMCAAALWGAIAELCIAVNDMAMRSPR